MRKVAIIGLDGVPYGLLAELALQGVMTNLRDLLDQGRFVRMYSSVPAVSSVAWSSVITGVNPGTHGIFGFTDIIAESYRVYFPNFSHLRVPPFWEREGFSPAVIVNVPSTYPVRPMRGVHIAGFVAPVLEKAVYPPEFVDTLKAWGYEVDVDAGLARESTDLFLRKLLESLDVRIRVALELLRNPWEVYMLVFTGTDRLLHFLWAAWADPGHPFHNRVLDYFRKLDHALGQVLAQINDNVPLIMLSDHGFEGLNTYVNLNAFLAEHGFLKFRKVPPRGPVDIDASSVAFALDPGRIYLHRRDRYPRGTVSPADEGRVLNDLVAALRELKVNGRPAVAEIHHRDEIYVGPEVPRAPDLVLEPEQGVEFKAGWKATVIIENSPFFTGKHRRNNAFLYVRDPGGKPTLPEQPTVEGIAAILEALKRR